MGRAFDPNDRLDRPDLNKCPDCECYFAGEKCPLCGRICPEEMRAGNRKEKPPKKSNRSGSGRVTFISWYHRWWFIILMALWSPIVAAILLITSPRRKSVKIGVIAAVVGAWVILPMLIHTLLVLLMGALAEPPVNDRLSREEYVNASVEADPDRLYRDPSSYGESILTLTLRVEEVLVGYDSEAMSGDPETYYLCSDREDPTRVFLLRDCLLNGDSEKNFLAGDTLTLYGESVGNRTVYTVDGAVRKAPCIHMAYATEAGE